MRLDQYLVTKHFFKTRHQAQLEIKNGRVSVNDAIVTKPSKNIHENDVIRLLEPYNIYASQGGLKLSKALDVFDIQPQGKIFLDVGSSTGGFTDCLLKTGANHVHAIDVGTQQMVDWLRNDSRVTLQEQTNILEVDMKTLPLIDMAVIDVSFTSCIPIIKHVSGLNKPIIVLIKPQFETMNRLKSGIVKDAKVHLNVLKHIQDELNTMKLSVESITHSPIKGKSGNIEFLALIGRQHCQHDLNDIVMKAHLLLNGRHLC